MSFEHAFVRQKIRQTEAKENFASLRYVRPVHPPPGDDSLFSFMCVTSGEDTSNIDDEQEKRGGSRALELCCVSCTKIVEQLKDYFLTLSRRLLLPLLGRS